LVLRCFVIDVVWVANGIFESSYYVIKMKHNRRGSMKKWMKFLTVALFVAFSVIPGSAFASVIAEDHDGAELDHAHRVRGALRMSGNVAILGSEVCTNISPMEFSQINGSAIVPLTAGTSPKLAVKNSLSSIVWVNAITSPVQMTFRVPTNYDSGGNFKVLIGRSGAGTAPSIDFQVFVNRTLTAFDAAATNQTEVQVSSSIASGSPEEKTLTVDTDFASLAAGDLVTWEIWRGTTGTESLEFYGGSFCYKIAH
jgi:hypothetical protein